MRHWNKLTVLSVAVALALVLPLAASAHRPPAGQKGHTQVAPRVATVTPRRAAPPLRYAFASATAFAAAEDCSSGAHTLSHFGDRVYPEMGNGGYTSLHTDVTLNYDALTNQFLPGTKADLTVQATQCLTDLSFDFERTNILTAGGTGPNMTVSSVAINGSPAAFTFVQPTYPGDPNGQNDPDPAAHAASTLNPVNASNPNPPACNPQSTSSSQVGLQCPADKLVVTPSVAIPDGSTITVTVNYTGRPGVHVDPDGSTEGWFRINTAGQEGSFVTTEPVGNDSWMPMNNHPLGKPTYDIIDTTNIGKTAIGPGELVGYTPPTGTTFQPVTPTSVNAPDANFPAGSWTWHWHSPEPIANYLVTNSVGQYDLTARTSPASGVQYWQAQATSITAARKAINKTAMDNQEDIVNFQTVFNGPWPFTTDGIVVGTPSASFEEEMQGKITFAGGQIGGSAGTSLGTFNHENMHQWFGDNVAEAAFNLTFWKEGFATLGEYLTTARGALPGVTGGTAFENSLIGRFNTNYGSTSSTFWTGAPSNPTAANLFNTANTYTRPGTSYVAMWQILGRDRMISSMKDIQSTYGGGNITEPQLKGMFRKWMPVQSASCGARLDQFFTEWYDTAYPSGGTNTTNKPKITGPSTPGFTGMNGTGFVCGKVTPAAPDGQNGWYTGDVDVTWQGFATPAFTKTGCADGPITTDGTTVRSCSVTTNAAPVLTSGAVSETVKRDAAAPVTTATIAPASPDGLNGWYLSPPSVTLSASDPTSGLSTTEYSLDGGPWTPYAGPISPSSEGGHSLDYRSTDLAGNVEPAQTITWAVDTMAPTTTAVLTPGIRNGWYANPALTFTVADGHGSGDITDPCPPRVLCGYSTVYSVDGGPFVAYEDPAHFGTGNHFVQYRTTDFAGRVEATKLVAFKVDADRPSVNITRPADGSSYPLDKVVTAVYKCTDRESGMDTCVGTVPSGSNLDTSTVGDHSFTVTATDKAGNVTTVTNHYQVTYTWNGFFSPITNTETGQLNLVHAGDTIKLGFSLNGDRGSNVFAAGFPTSVVIACPSWPPHSVPAAGAGTPLGLSYGIASGHYTYGWGTSSAWAGTCRRFEIQLNDGTSTLHTADFMFFA